MSDKMREEFEAWLSEKYGKHLVSRWDERTQDYNYLACTIAFEAWKVSREQAYTAIDMTTAAADGFRDGAASKSEPCDGCFMAEAEALRKDAERLNWLDGRSCAVVENQCYSQPEGELAGYDWSIFGQCGTVREAIDYAMSKEPKD